MHRGGQPASLVAGASNEQPRLSRINAVHHLIKAIGRLNSPVMVCRLDVSIKVATVHPPQALFA
jgi:hypothetical protein